MTGRTVPITGNVNWLQGTLTAPRYCWPFDKIEIEIDRRDSDDEDEC